VTSLSTHVLDTGNGLPAVGIDVSVERLVDEEWVGHGEGTTDVNGRITGFGKGFASGTYRLRFATGAYGNLFYPEVAIMVNLDAEEDHYHVPLLLSPFGYSTYRGS
jgi:5-hydroxyisourate hydrolase